MSVSFLFIPPSIFFIKVPVKVEMVQSGTEYKFERLLVLNQQLTLSVEVSERAYPLYRFTPFSTSKSRRRTSALFMADAVVVFEHKPQIRSLFDDNYLLENKTLTKAIFDATTASLDRVRSPRSAQGVHCYCLRLELILHSAAAPPPPTRTPMPDSALSPLRLWSTSSESV